MPKWLTILELFIGQEQERLQKILPDQSHSLLSVPPFRPRSSSLTPFTYEEDVCVRSRSGSFGTPIPSPLALSDCEDSSEEVK